MKRLAGFAVTLLLVGCSANGPSGSEPESLAMTDPGAEVASTQSTNDVMYFDIDGERFELNAGICDTYDNGTFHFALAEGRVENTGRATATIERFDTGAGYEMILALEGLLEDGTAVSWYAREGVVAHELTVSVIGSSIEGTAIFDSIGGPDTPGRDAAGSFAIRCG
jgi:hypothetical protein